MPPVTGLMPKRPRPPEGIALLFEQGSGEPVDVRKDIRRRLFTYQHCHNCHNYSINKKCTYGKLLMTTQENMSCVRYSCHFYDPLAKFDPTQPMRQTTDYKLDLLTEKLGILNA